MAMDWIVAPRRIASPEQIEQSRALDGPRVRTQPAYIPPAARKYTPESGDFIRTRNQGIMPLRSPVPGDVQSGAALARYALIAKNPVVKTALDTALLGTFWSEWEINAINDYDRYPEFEALDNTILMMIKDQLAELEYVTVDQVLRNIYRDGRVYGLTISELVFNSDADYRKRGINRVAAVKTHWPADFDIWVDPVGNIERLFYRPLGEWIEGERLNKFVVAPYPSLIDGNYYGTSDLQSVLQDVQLLEVIEEFEAQAMKRLAVRPILLHYAQQMSSAELQTLESILTSIDSSSVAAIPANRDTNGAFVKSFDIGVLEDRASADGVELISDIKLMLQKRIMRTLGVPDDIGLTDVDAGSYAKSQTELEIQLARLVEWQRWIEGVVNRQIIPACVVYNYSTLPDYYRLPVMKFATLEEYNAKITTESTLQLLDKGVISLQEARDTLDLGPAPMEIRTAEHAGEIAQGPQITTAVSIVAGVKAGTLPRDAGIALMQKFFNVPYEEAIKMIGVTDETITQSATVDTPNVATADAQGLLGVQ